MESFSRPLLKTVVQRLREPRKFIQVLLGPRQSGKTTLVKQALAALDAPCHYVSADEPSSRGEAWIEAQWLVGRARAKAGGPAGAILVLDEAQKVGRWSETVKRLWDEDAGSGLPLKVVLLGSAPVLIGSGLSESLAGRFEVVRVSHWSLGEVKAAFGWDLERFLFFGGYPGSAGLIDDEERWRRYILDSLVETTVSRDILLQTRVDKPALLRSLFRLGCDYSGQILAYQKMLGQLSGAGNTVTLAHYLGLLSDAGMLAGLQKFSGTKLRQRGSSPKLLALNTALMTSGGELSFAAARSSPDAWGRLVETAVGAHLVNGLPTGAEVFYWREANREVDFVVRLKGRVTAVEVTSSRRKDARPGLGAFAEEFHPRKSLLVGGQGIPLEEFLSAPPEDWLT